MKITLEDIEKEKDPKKLAEEAERAKQAQERDRNWEDTKGFGQKIREEKAKFSKMNKTERWSYFRSYYLLPCIAILAALILGGTMARDILRGQGEILISGMFLNTSISDEGQTALEKEYVEYLGRTGDKVHVNMVQYIMDFSGDGYISSSYQIQMAVVTQLAAGTLDFVLADESAFEYLGSRSMMCDPKDVLTPETYEKYKDHLVFREVEKFTAEETEAETGNGQISEAAGTDGMIQIAAYNIVGTKLAEYLNWPEADQAYLVLICQEEDAQRVGQFLDFLFEG